MASEPTGIRELSQQLVVFSLGDEEYALPITQVHEIIRYAEPRAVASDDPSIAGFVEAIAKIDDRLVVLLNPDELFTGLTLAAAA